MEHYGVRGVLLEWFKSYLTGRNQYVFYNGESSDLKPISCGVPQGSVLGPLLFLLYINDLHNVSSKLKFFLFADDTNIYFEADDMLKVEKVVNNELKKTILMVKCQSPFSKCQQNKLYNLPSVKDTHYYTN